MNKPQEKLLVLNRILIADEVNRDTFAYVREAIALKMLEGNPTLTIHLSSGGGRVSAGLDIYDLLKFYNGEKIGVVHSLAASMAAVILQGCDWRTATPHSDILIHHVSSRDISLDTVRDPEKLSKFIERLETDQQKLYQILMSRTGKSIEEIRKTCELDQNMCAKEALDYGLIDQIISNEIEINFPKK